MTNEKEIKKEKVGRNWYYTIPLQIEGVRFEIVISKNQLVKISKERSHTRIHVDVYTK